MAEAQLARLEGKPDEAMKKAFTLVLKGHIALATARFPKGTTGSQLDSLARMALWQKGLDYDHGTGHGVGYFMNVHEGPQSIAYRATVNPNMGMEPGMITSNEPGLYRPGRWGIRIENLVLAAPAVETEFGEFLLPGRYDEGCQPSIRWQERRLANLDLALEEGFAVARDNGFHDRMVGQVRLHETRALGEHAAGPARDLHASSLVRHPACRMSDTAPRPDHAPARC